MEVSCVDAKAVGKLDTDRESHTTVRSKRIVYFDYLKCLSILLVITLHSSWLRATIPASIATTLASSAVPVFFMVHGALMLNRPTEPGKAVKKAGKLFLQMEAWNVLYILFSLLFGMVRLEQITWRFLYDSFICGKNMSGNGLISNGHLWFIYALIVVYLMYPLLSCLHDKNSKSLRYAAVMCLVFSVVLYELNFYIGCAGKHFMDKTVSIEWLVNEYNPFGKYGNCIFYFILGYLITEWIQNRAEQSKRNKYILIASFAIVAGVVWNMFDRVLEYGQLEHNWKQIKNQYVRPGTVLMSFGVFVLFAFIHFSEGKIYRVIKAVSTHTLDIYYTHVLWIYNPFVAITLKRLIPHNVAVNFLRAAAALALSYFAGQIIRRIPGIRRLLE